MGTIRRDDMGGGVTDKLLTCDVRQAELAK